MNKCFVILFYSVFLLTEVLYPQIAVETNFEGGNTQVVSINNSANTVKIKATYKTGDTHASVFYCKITGYNTSLPLKIQLQTIDQTYTPVLPAYSYDKISWIRITGTFISDYKEYIIANTQAGEIYFSMGYPYLYSTLLNFAENLSTNNYVQVSDIATSLQNRSVKLFRFTDNCIPDSLKYLVWFIGRQHAFESHSSYVLEGLMSFLASGDSKAAKLRKRAIVYIVPMMDVDMVYNGGTGKDQIPVDFNRDWDSPSYWSAVIAVKQKVLETAALNPLKIFIDSHDPWPSDNSAISSLLFYSVMDTGVRSVNLDVYRNMFERIAGYPVDRQSLYPTAGQTSNKWVDSLIANIDFSASLETGFINRTDNTEWTIPSYKLNGMNLGRTVNDYLGNILKPDDIIIDNTDFVNLAITGSWYAITSPPGFWGVNCLTDGNSVKGTKNVKYIPQIPANEKYEVFLRWSAAGNRPVNVPVRISYSGGIFDTVVNQQTQGGEWASVGEYNFASGNTNYVMIKNDSTSGFVIADAVRFSKRVDCGSINIRNENENVPENFALTAYPNPFNQFSIINIKCSISSDVKIQVFDISGKLIATILNEYKTAGSYSIQFNGENLTSGIYILKLTAGKYSTNKKIVLLK